MLIGVNLTLKGRLETASTQTKPTFPCGTLRERGLIILDFVLVHEREERLEEKVDFVCVAAYS